MTLITDDVFEKLIRDAGESWLIDRHAPPQDALNRLRDALEAADNKARERLGSEAIPITAEALIAESQRNPHKVRAFLQALGSISSPDMLGMVWRILHGATIADVRLNYHLQKSFSLQITLWEDRPDTYDSSDIHDAAVLRHFGIMELDDRPIFDGFFALSVNEK